MVATNIDDVFQRAVNDRNKSRSFGSVDPPMKLSDIFAARANLQNRKSGGGGSLVVNEMLKLMPYLMVFVVWRMMVGRYDGSQEEIVQSWLLILINFIPKSKVQTQMADFRGICLLETMSKWYMGVVIRMVNRQFYPWKFVV